MIVKGKDRLCKIRPLFGAIAALLLFGCSSGSRSATVPGQPLPDGNQQAVTAALDLMQSKKLNAYSTLGRKIDRSGRIRLALPSDQYLAGAEKAGDTPYAYTMPDDSHAKQPIAIVLAPRFFDASPPSQAALLLHELGHWMAFQRTGKSDEYDGYKAEFDAHKKLGLTERDGLPYASMLDGVEQYVIPRDKHYAQEPEIKEFDKESGGT